ncbi:MAG: universal stress protein [Pseudomonadota bacterium]
MDTVNKILAPTDLSESSKPGVRYALQMAASVNAHLIVYHVASYDSDFPYPLGIGEVSSAYLPTQDFDDFLRGRKHSLKSFVNDNFKDLCSAVKLSLEIDVGEAQEMILQKAEQNNVDMIVMSTHGRTGLGHILIGSITEYIVRHAHCPVLSIRSKPQNP